MCRFAFLPRRAALVARVELLLIVACLLAGVLALGKSSNKVVVGPLFLHPHFVSTSVDAVNGVLRPGRPRSETPMSKSSGPAVEAGLVGVYPPLCRLPFRPTPAQAPLAFAGPVLAQAGPVPRCVAHFNKPTSPRPQLRAQLLTPTPPTPEAREDDLQSLAVSKPTTSSWPVMVDHAVTLLFAFIDDGRQRRPHQKLDFGQHVAPMRRLTATRGVQRVPGVCIIPGCLEYQSHSCRLLMVSASLMPETSFDIIPYSAR